MRVFVFTVLVVFSGTMGCDGYISSRQPIVQPHLPSAETKSEIVIERKMHESYFYPDPTRGFIFNNTSHFVLDIWIDPELNESDIPTSYQKALYLNPGHHKIIYLDTGSHVAYVQARFFTRHFKEKFLGYITRQVLVDAEFFYYYPYYYGYGGYGAHRPYYPPSAGYYGWSLELRQEDFPRFPD